LESYCKARGSETVVIRFILIQAILKINAGRSKYLGFDGNVLRFNSRKVITVVRYAIGIAVRLANRIHTVRKN
jgi:hypothetical protein